MSARTSSATRPSSSCSSTASTATSSRQFEWVVETERRFYLANAVDGHARTPTARSGSRSTLTDAWVWDMYRPARFVKTVRVLTFKDVNVERLEKPDLELPQP